MENEEQIIYQLENDVITLLESPPSYMREIGKISKKVVNLEIKYILYVLNKIRKTIYDPLVSIKKKLFAFRFIKDTLLLASHSFYILAVITIFPLIKQVLEVGSKANDNGLEFLIKSIGPNPEVSNALEIKTFSTTILQLFTEMMKWLGTYIKMHPFYKIPYPSTFKLCLETLPKVKSIKVTELTYYTTDSVKTYEQNYLQKQLSSQQEHLKEQKFTQFLLSSCISLPEDEPDKQKSLELMQKIVETGDSILIRLIVDNLKQMLESQITGYQSILVVNQLLRVKQMQFCILVRDEILFPLAYYMLMMSKENFSKLEFIDLNKILKIVFVWKKLYLKLGLQTKTFNCFFDKMKDEKIFQSPLIFSTDTEHIERDFQNYKHFLSFEKLQQINAQKKSHLSLKDNEKSLKMIQSLRYKMRNDLNKLMFSNENLGDASQNSIKKGKESFNIQNSLKINKQQFRFPQGEQSINISANSPIKQLKMSNFDRPLQKPNDSINNEKQQYIRFSNSLNNLSSSKQNVLASQQQMRKNIYTKKDQQNNEKKSMLSRSSRSNKSSKSKRSLGKVDKASSFKFGLQKVKSSNVILYSDKSQQNDDSNKLKQVIKNKNKLNLIKFDESSPNIKERNGHSLESDNFPYKDQSSNSINYQDHSNQNKTKVSNTNSQRKLMKNQQIILVEETVKKPKFGFAKNIEIQTSNYSLAQPNNLKIQSNKNLQDQSSTDRSLKVDPQFLFQDKLSKYSSIPSDFNAAFKKNNKNKQNSKYSDSDSDSKLNIKFNKFPHKLKQIQLQIQKAKQFQLLYQEKMTQKDQQLDNLTKNLPPTNQKIYQENQKLKEQLKQKQRKEVQKIALKEKRSFKSPNKMNKKKQQISFLSDKIFSLGIVKPFDSDFRKEMISNKCLIQKNQIFQLGYSFKRENSQQMGLKKVNFTISFYFKFKVECENFKIKLINGSLNTIEVVDTSLENILANKQMKFQQKITGYTLFNETFVIPQLQIQSKINYKLLAQINGKKRKMKQNLCQQKYRIKTPCSLFNFLEFHTPSKKIEFIKTKYAIEAQFSVPQLCSSIQGEFLLNSFKCGQWHENQQNQGGFYVSYYTYIKDIKQKKRNDLKNYSVQFQELRSLQRKEVNFYIRKLNQIMFYIESDNQFQADKIVLIQISKVLAR